MKTSEVMDRVKLLCPSFATVAHALTSAADPAPYPAALVTPSRTTAASNPFLGQTVVANGGVWSQEVTQIFSVFIIQERRQDTATSSAADDLDTLTNELRAALVGWTGGSSFAAPMQYAGGALSEFRPGIAAWREDFSIETEMRVAPHV